MRRRWRSTPRLPRRLTKVVAPASEEVSSLGSRGICTAIPFPARKTPEASAPAKLHISTADALAANSPPAACETGRALRFNPSPSPILPSGLWRQALDEETPPAAAALQSSDPGAAARNAEHPVADISMAMEVATTPVAFIAREKGVANPSLCVDTASSLQALDTFQGGLT